MIGANATSLGINADPGTAPDPKKVKKAVSSRVRVAGRVLDKKTQYTEIQILRGVSMLAGQGALETSAIDSISFETANLLTSMGCSYDTYKDASYSLTSEQTDIETTNNPNIRDASPRRSPGASSGLESTEASFSSLSDPFYEPDTTVEPATTIAAGVTQTLSRGCETTTLVSDIVKVNTGIAYDTKSKYFTPSTTAPSHSTYTKPSMTHTIEPEPLATSTTAAPTSTTAASTTTSTDSSILSAVARELGIDATLLGIK